MNTAKNPKNFYRNVIKVFNLVYLNILILNVRQSGGNFHDAYICNKGLKGLI